MSLRCDNLQETFGISIIEAMAAGTAAVVASDFSGYRDLVLHGKTGLLIPSLAPSDYRILDEALAHPAESGSRPAGGPSAPPWT